MTHSWLLFVIYALAVYRLTRLIVVDEVMRGVREWVQARAYQPVESAESIVTVRSAPWAWLFFLITCAWCISIWLAAICVALRFATTYWDFAMAALAFATLAGIMSERL